MMEKLSCSTLQFRLTCSPISTPLHNNLLSPEQALGARGSSRAKKAEEIAVSRREGGFPKEEAGVVDGAWLWRVAGQKCARRRVLAGIGAWPILVTTMLGPSLEFVKFSHLGTTAHGRNFTNMFTRHACPSPTKLKGRHVVNAVEFPEDPAEMAVVAALDARDMLPALSTFLLQAKSKLGPSVECQSRLKSLNRIYERLKVNLPRLVEELEISDEFAEQLLQGFVYVEEDLCSRIMVSSTMSESSSISRMNIEGSLKLLKLARNKVDILLQKVPRQLLELAQLARGVRPMA